MAATDFARLFYAMNTIIEDASSSVGLSKRAALALAILAGAPKSLDIRDQHTMMTNQKLQEFFVELRISTPASAKKDASAAKGELLGKKYIQIENKVSVFAVSADGERVVEKLHEAMKNTIEEIGLAEHERALLGQLVSLEQRQPPKPARASSPEKTARGDARERVG